MYLHNYMKQFISVQCDYKLPKDLKKQSFDLVKGYIRVRVCIFIQCSDGIITNNQSTSLIIVEDQGICCVPQSKCGFL